MKRSLLALLAVIAIAAPASAAHAQNGDRRLTPAETMAYMMAEAKKYDECYARATPPGAKLPTRAAAKKCRDQIGK